jgi:hypothetical protein
MVRVHVEVDRQVRVGEVVVGPGQKDNKTRKIRFCSRTRAEQAEESDQLKPVFTKLLIEVPLFAPFYDLDQTQTCYSRKSVETLKVSKYS